MDGFQRRLAHAVVLSAVLTISVARAAAPPSSPMLVVGIGDSSCREYLRSAVADRLARPADPNAQDRFFNLDYGLYMLWVDGYLTAANSYDPDKRMSGQNTTHLARMQWVERFCGDHPKSPFLAAVNALHEASDVLAIGATSFVVGIGDSSCREYLISAVADRLARPADPKAQDRFFDPDYGLYMLWVDGYLTAANSYDPVKRMSGQNTTHLARMQWVERFCGDHPKSPFLAAVNALHEASDVPAIGVTSFEPSSPLPELPKEKLVIVNYRGERHEFDVEVAITPDQVNTGLMFRKSLPPNGGMLSDYGSPQSVFTWMKNTVISLDMLFIDADGTIRHIAAHTVPGSVQRIDSGGPVRATLGLPAGTAERLDVRVGDTVLAQEFGNSLSTPNTPNRAGGK